MYSNCGLESLSDCFSTPTGLSDAYQHVHSDTQHGNNTPSLRSPYRCRWLPLLRLLLRPTPLRPLPWGRLQSPTTLRGRSSECGDFSDQGWEEMSQTSESFSSYEVKPKSVCATHPGTSILSLVTHQDVKHVSFLQGKYGRYEDPMVAFVVVFGSFPSRSSIGWNPEGDHCKHKRITCWRVLLSGPGFTLYILHGVDTWQVLVQTFYM